jgi:4'-phosphopantetheinyl transferase
MIKKKEILTVFQPNIYIEKFNLIRPDQAFPAALCCCELSMFDRDAANVDFLHPQERRYYETLKFERRIKSYLMGRLAAKKAIAALTGSSDLSRIIIQAGIFTQPIATCEGQPNIQVSISHCTDFGAALAFPEAHPMGIDLEQVNIEQNKVIEREVTESELTLVKRLPIPYEVMLTLLWTGKEALSKVLRTGLMTPFPIFEADKIELRQDYILSHYKNFAQYKAISFILGACVCSIACPMKTEFTINIQSLQETCHFQNSRELTAN